MAENRYEVEAELNKSIALVLLRSCPIARIAYTGLDGAPRVIPVGFLWTDRTLDFWTAPTSAKVAALESDPRVAITIDTTTQPPRALLIRGVATLTTMPGVPDEYVAASMKGIPDSGRAEFTSQVRDLYDEMTCVSILPMWAKLLDFETVIPSAVAELVRNKTR
ncbi:pyridoxamine 5'-phosphate oxidase family protein [Aldersonia kunmingensis]|uniref:pyridoxamine 5'-phosphate oxidase family protein n=1 Tax=Aldersonia kunmingensis TaxID=408066 RepID=UPI000829FC12|nr:pyridoxamine 5'-phosphate oxidase family protein [Aldersonia kunmingensis]